MINTHLIDLPFEVKATHTKNEDDSFSIFINNRLSREQQLEAYNHEIIHILNNDLCKNDYADLIELRILRK